MPIRRKLQKARPKSHNPPTYKKDVFFDAVQVQPSSPSPINPPNNRETINTNLRHNPPHPPARRCVSLPPQPQYQPHIAHLMQDPPPYHSEKECVTTDLLNLDLRKKLPVEPDSLHTTDTERISRRTRPKTPVFEIGQLERRASYVPSSLSSTYLSLSSPTCPSAGREQKPDPTQSLALTYQSLLPIRTITPSPSPCPSLRKRRPKSLRKIKCQSSLRDLSNDQARSSTYSTYSHSSSLSSSSSFSLSSSSSRPSSLSSPSSSIGSTSPIRSSYSDTDTLIGSGCESQSPSSLKFPLKQDLLFSTQQYDPQPKHLEDDDDDISTYSTPETENENQNQNQSFNFNLNLPIITPNSSDAAHQLSRTLTPSFSSSSLLRTSLNQLTAELATSLFQPGTASSHPTSNTPRASRAQLDLMIAAHSRVQRRVRKQISCKEGKLNRKSEGESEETRLLRDVEVVLGHWIQVLCAVRDVSPSSSSSLHTTKRVEEYSDAEWEEHQEEEGSTNGQQQYWEDENEVENGQYSGREVHGVGQGNQYYSHADYFDGLGNGDNYGNGNGDNNCGDGGGDDGNFADWPRPLELSRCKEIGVAR